MNELRKAYVSFPILQLVEDLKTAKNPQHRAVYRERLEATRDFINEELAKLNKPSVK
jgi:hypothetical protein